MAYVIGSQKGKDIAASMKTGETYKASDGSTWTKKSDGSVTVTEKNGATWDNAYTSPSSGGGSKGSSSGGGGTSNTPSNGGNSQYSSYQYTIGSDRGKNMAQSMEIGTSWTNDVDGSVWTKNPDGSVTVNHNGIVTQNAWVPTTTNPTLPFDYNDFFEYIENYNQNNSKPSQQQRDPRIDALLNEILTRDDFSYNALNDPRYQQYAQMYQREGDRAMRETMAEAAASAGGMNTYAMTAAQQAANYYNSQLGDKIPELYQLAYDMYLNDKNSKVQNLGILQNMDDTQYARYRDTMNDWYNDKNFAYKVYQDAVDQGNWITDYNRDVYTSDRDFGFKSYWANTEYFDKKAEKDRDDARERLREIIAKGNTPDAELIKSSEYTQEEVDLMIKEEALKKYQTIDTQCVELFKIGGWAMVKPALDDAKELGLIDETAYTTLSDKYQNMK